MRREVDILCDLRRAEGGFDDVVFAAEFETAGECACRGEVYF